jgi:hypothetical protein
VLWEDWADHKQTYQELSEDHDKSIRWVQKALDKDKSDYSLRLIPQPTCISMDSSGFGDFGIMVWRSPGLKRNLHAKVILSETIEEYKAGLKHLMDLGWKINAIISDGRGLNQDFFGLPVQMCHFHQVKIITKYLTKHPRSRPSIELRSLALKLSKTDKASFTGWLNEWYEKYQDFLKEKTLNLETGKQFYTHRRVRSAYFSLKRNLPYLFTFEDHIELNIPNTNNGMEGTFSYIKKKVNIHNGLRRDRKIKLIFYLLFREKKPPKKFH